MQKVKKIILAAVLLALAIGYYFYLSNRMVTSETQVDTSKVSQVLVKDLELDYPASPKEVIKFYNEILLCFYNEKYTKEELTALGLQARGLFDDELAANQTQEEYLTALKADIDLYKKEKRIIISTSVASADEVVYFTHDERECASVTASYTLRADTQYEKTFQEYILRKDSEGRWKMLGWQETSSPEEKE